MLKSAYKSSKRLAEMLLIFRKYEILSTPMTPEKFRLILEDLGPTFIKLGQMLSLRPHLLPEDYSKELAKLQTNAIPLDFKVIQEILTTEYARPLNNIFTYIDPEPLGSASMAQVHRAELLSGERIVLKIQRPGIYEVMAKDIALLSRVLQLLHTFRPNEVIDFNALLKEMWTITQQEMDFLLEAEHLREFKLHNANFPYIDCPSVYAPLTTSKILAMEYIDGITIDNKAALQKEAYDLSELALELGENYLKQILEDGYFHADPHPGNIIVKDRVIYLLDFGMVGRLAKHERDDLKDIILALAKKDIKAFKIALLDLGSNSPTELNEEKLQRDLQLIIDKYASVNLANLSLGSFGQDLLRLALEHKLQLSPSLSTFTRGAVTLESVLRDLAPDLSIQDLLHAYLHRTIPLKSKAKEDFPFLKDETIALLYKSLELPEQLSEFLKMTVRGKTKVNLDLTGSQEPLNKFDRMINKLIVGIILSALLLGSSIICTTNMTPKLFDIPLLGVMGFLAALILSLRLLISILKD